MLIVATATSPTGAVTHHLVRADVGSEAYRRLKPLVTPESEIDTCSVTWRRATRGELPQDPVTPAERTDLEVAGARLIDPASPPPPPGPGVHSRHDRSPP